jgi:hypothetical protein
MNNFHSDPIFKKKSKSSLSIIKSSQSTPLSLVWTSKLKSQLQDSWEARFKFNTYKRKMSYSLFNVQFYLHPYNTCNRWAIISNPKWWCLAEECPTSFTRRMLKTFAMELRWQWPAVERWSNPINHEVAKSSLMVSLTIPTVVTTWGGWKSTWNQGQISLEKSRSGNLWGSTEWTSTKMSKTLSMHLIGLASPK